MSSKSLTGRHWRLLDADLPTCRKLEEDQNLSPLVACCLSLGPGSTDPDRWLEPGWADLHDPALMHGLDAAVVRITQAVASGEHIRIVTDYDVDGTTSSLILQHSLRLLGASGELSYHIPNRFHEGYGFSTWAAERAAEDGVGLIITADIGVRDHDAVSRARELGIDVIVCDHHLPHGEDVPEAAVAVLCPP